MNIDYLKSILKDSENVAKDGVFYHVNPSFTSVVMDVIKIHGKSFKNNLKNTLIISRDYDLSYRIRELSRDAIVLKMEQAQRPNSKQRLLISKISNIIIDSRDMNLDSIKKSVELLKNTFNVKQINIVDITPDVDLENSLKNDLSAKIIKMKSNTIREHTSYPIQHGKRIDSLEIILKKLTDKSDLNFLIYTNYENKKAVEKCIKGLKNIKNSIKTIDKEYVESNNINDINHLICFECPKHVEEYGALLTAKKDHEKKINYHILYDKTRENELMELINLSIPEVIKTGVLSQENEKKVESVSVEKVKIGFKKLSKKKLNQNLGFQKFVPEFMNYSLVIQ